MKMNNLLISNYLWKNVFHALSFPLCSTASSKFSFYVSLCQINPIKVQTMSLVSKSIYFGRDSLFYLFTQAS